MSYKGIDLLRSRNSPLLDLFDLLLKAVKYLRLSFLSGPSGFRGFIPGKAFFNFFLETRSVGPCKPPLQRICLHLCIKWWYGGKSQIKKQCISNCLCRDFCR